MQTINSPMPVNSPIDDTQTVLASSHVLIRDKQTGKILVNKRGS